MAVVLQLVTQLIATLEGGLYPTSNLVKNYVIGKDDRSLGTGEDYHHIIPWQEGNYKDSIPLQIITIYLVKLSLCIVTLNPYRFACVLGVRVPLLGTRIPFLV